MTARRQGFGKIRIGLEEAQVLKGTGARRTIVAAMLAAMMVLAGATSVYAAGSVRKADVATAPEMGAASTYSILASSTVQSSGDTSITGDVGTWPGTGITGFPPGTINGGGATHAGDQPAQDARSALASAFATLESVAASAPVISPTFITFDANGGPVTPGQYAFAAGSKVDGAIQLGLTDSDDPSDIVVFHVPGDLTIASGAQMELTGGLSSDHVFWCVDGTVTVAGGAKVVGSILASGPVSLGSGASVHGKVVSLGDSVQLTAASVDGVTAVASDPGSGSGDGTGSGSGSGTSGGTLPATGEDGPASSLPFLLAFAGSAALAGGFVLSRRGAR